MHGLFSIRFRLKDVIFKTGAENSGHEKKN